MAWEQRTRGTRYYTRSRKVAGRVVREYVGGGAVGALAEAGDAQARAEVKKRDRAWMVLRSRLESAERVTYEFCRATETLSRNALHLAGYHQHHRGEWRKNCG